MPSITSEPLVTTTEAAAILGTTRSKIQWLIEQGKLRSFHLPEGRRAKGMKRYVARRDLEALQLAEALTREQAAG